LGLFDELEELAVKVTDRLVTAMVHSLAPTEIIWERPANLFQVHS
jgi:hypothetical protein